MLTEEEAKTKWCPMARPFDPEKVTVAGGRCNGSACMAWQFQPQMWRHTSAAGAGTWDEPKEVNGYGRKGQKLPLVGHCGLVRRPE